MGVLNVDDATYRALNRWSWSTAKHVLECPAEAYDQRTRPIETTDAMEMGTLMHALILEPEEVEKHYAVAPKIVKGLGGWTWPGHEMTWRLKKEAEATLAGIMGERFLVTQELMDDLTARCDQARLWVLAHQPHVEMAMVGQIEGASVKGKADMVCGNAIIDVKTTTDIKPASIQRAAVQRHWLGQVWTYGELARQSGHPIDRYGILLVQTPKVSNSPLNLSKSRQPRQSWRIIWLDAEAIAYGESEARRVWRAIRDCEASGEWPDYAGDSLSLPRWAKPEAVQEEAF